MAERVGVTIREAEANQSYRGRLADGGDGQVLQTRDDRSSEVVVHDRQRIANDVSRLHGKRPRSVMLGILASRKNRARGRSSSPARDRS